MAFGASSGSSITFHTTSLEGTRDYALQNKRTRWYRFVHGERCLLWSARNRGGTAIKVSDERLSHFHSTGQKSVHQIELPSQMASVVLLDLLAVKIRESCCSQLALAFLLTYFATALIQGMSSIVEPPVHSCFYQPRVPLRLAFGIVLTFLRTYLINSMELDYRGYCLSQELHANVFAPQCLCRDHVNAHFLDPGPNSGLHGCRARKRTSGNGIWRRDGGR